MTSINLNKLKRLTARIHRKQHHNWSVRIGEDVLITRNITNLSPTGMALKAPEWSDFKPGQYLKLQLFLNKEQNFECDAKVVWTKNTEERAGAMKLLGIEFSKLPAHIDSAIMKLVNDDALSERRLAFANGLAQIGLISPKKLNLRSLFSTIMGALVIASLTASLMAALYIHKKNHPEESLAYKFTESFNKRLTATATENPSK
jgi:hypothetical protein